MTLQDKRVFKHFVVCCSPMINLKYAVSAMIEQVIFPAYAQVTQVLKQE